MLRDFPGGAEVGSPPTIAGDTLQGRFEPWSGKIPHATEQLSPCAATTEPRATTTEARTPRACVPQQEKPLQ